VLEVADQHDAVPGRDPEHREEAHHDPIESTPPLM
jgi:hypothetical protein